MLEQRWRRCGDSSAGEDAGRSGVIVHADGSQWRSASTGGGARRGIVWTADGGSCCGARCGWVGVTHGYQPNLPVAVAEGGAYHWLCLLFGRA